MERQKLEGKQIRERHKESPAETTVIAELGRGVHIDHEYAQG